MRKRASVQQTFIDLEDIRDDVVCLTHRRYRAVLEVGSVGFNLLGETEQEALLASYCAFLNSLTFDFQIVVWPTPIDVSARRDWLEERSHELSDLLAEVARDQAAHFQQLARTRSLLERRFYAVVPADTEMGGRRWPWRRAEPGPALDAARQNLTFRCEEVIRELGRCGLTPRRLNGEQLTALYQAWWNPEPGRLGRLRQDLADYLSWVVEGQAKGGR